MTTISNTIQMINCCKLEASYSNHSDNIENAFNSITIAQNDVRIISGDKEEIWTNKLVLSLFSPLLSSLFSTDDCHLLLLPDYSSTSIKNLLRLISTGFTFSKNDSYEDIEHIIDIARLLSINMKMINLIPSTNIESSEQYNKFDDFGNNNREQYIEADEVDKGYFENKKTIIAQVDNLQVKRKAEKEKVEHTKKKKPNTIPVLVDNQHNFIDKSEHTSVEDESIYVSNKEDIPVSIDDDAYDDMFDNFSSFQEDSNHKIETISEKEKCIEKNNVKETKSVLDDLKEMTPLMEELEQVSFISSKRGGQHLVYKKFVYMLMRENGDSVRWRCQKYPSGKCPGKLSTEKDRTTILAGTETPHNHAPDTDLLEVRKFVAAVKKSAAESPDARTRDILATEQAKLPASAQLASPLPQSMVRIIQKIRRHNRTPDQSQLIWKFGRSKRPFFYKKEMAPTTP